MCNPRGPLQIDYLKANVLEELMVNVSNQMHFVPITGRCDQKRLTRVASGLEKSGKFDIFSRSGNCQGILKIGQ